MTQTVITRLYDVKQNNLTRDVEWVSVNAMT